MTGVQKTRIARVRGTTCFTHSIFPGYKLIRSLNILAASLPIDSVGSRGMSGARRFSPSRDKP